jgi:uncharacterized protein
LPILNPFEEYIIPYKGLKDGIHQFDFQIDDSFFNLFPEGEIREGKVFVEVEMEKRPGFLVFRFDLEGVVRTECDVCLEELDLPIEFLDELVIKFGEVIEDLQIAGEEKPLLTEQDHEFNLAHALYEMIHLSLPLRRVHPETPEGQLSCNPDMLNEIARYRAAAESQEKTDPRWDGLRELFN